MNRRGNTRPTVVGTDLDDWETDPDFVRDMDEIDQRWGAKRTVGSINMNELIDEVRKDHKIMREKFDHPSQRDHSDGFGGKFGIQHDRKDQSAHDYDYHEELSKHTSQEISRKVITTSSSSIIKGGSGSISDAKRTFLEQSNEKDSNRSHQQKSRSPQPPPSMNRLKPDRIDDFTSPKSTSNSHLDLGDAKPKFEESTTRRFVREEKTSSSSSLGRGPNDVPPAMRSIQEKIDAFKRDFEDMKSKVGKRADSAKVIKKTVNIEKNSNVSENYVSRSDNSNISEQGRPISPPSATRPTYTSTSPSHRSQQDNLPKTSIKSLSQKFETLCREDSEDFKRKTEARRKEFFDQIKTQVRETRKELDGFDPIDDDVDDDDNFEAIHRKINEKIEARRSPLSGVRQGEESEGWQHGKYTSTATTSPSGSKFKSTPSPTSPSSRPSSRLSAGSGSQFSSSLGKPKVYTRRETSQEEVVSKVVKENDKIIENETKRNVERSSSCYGSSDEGEEPISIIKHIDRELKSSPVEREESPVEKLKRAHPFSGPIIKGAGLMARTLYEYKAEENDELSFEADDLITNIEKIDSGWYKGTISHKGGSKQVGLFPANYVRLLNDASEY